MKKVHFPPINRFIVVISVLTILLFGCSTIPPVQPAKDMKSFVGKWEGKVWNVDRGWDFSVTLTAEEDGLFLLTLPSFLGIGLTHIVGTWGLKDGKFWFKSEIFWMNGTGILHEGGGKRAVIFNSDDGRTRGWITPGKSINFK